jgi:hypothetical protein
VPSGFCRAERPIVRLRDCAVVEIGCGQQKAAALFETPGDASHEAIVVKNVLYIFGADCNVESFAVFAVLIKFAHVANAKASAICTTQNRAPRRFGLVSFVPTQSKRRVAPQSCSDCERTSAAAPAMQQTIPLDLTA